MAVQLKEETKNSTKNPSKANLDRFLKPSSANKDSKLEYARIVDQASKEMITEPIKDIIDEYANIADKNKIEYGKEYSAKYGCTKDNNYSSFRPSSSDKKDDGSLVSQLDSMIKKGEAQQKESSVV